MLSSQYVRRPQWKIAIAPGVRSRIPAEDSLRAFLVDFRQIFLLQNEPCYIKPLYAAASRTIRDEEIRGKIMALARHTRKARYATSMTVTIDGRCLKPHELVEAWVSHWFHADEPNAALESRKGRRLALLQFPMAFHFHFCIQETRILLDLIREGRRRDSAA